MSRTETINPYLPARDRAIPLKAVANGGFNSDEAKQLLEFCIELNNQDDRNSVVPDSTKNCFAKPAGWQLVYDSRNPENTQWNRHYDYSEADKESGKPDPNNVKTNGLSPFNNAWILAQAGDDPSRYALAIRGTVSEFKSILADAYASTIPAYAGIEYPKNRTLPIAFAATPKAEIHLGFAYAAFSLLFNTEFGILMQLQKLIRQNKPISQLFITGHSQGAAVATLMHAFLYYAIQDPIDRYQLQSLQNTLLKSYLFAQPKPGNLQFAQDFARITRDCAFVINNDRDPVPQVPLSLETVSEVAQFVEEDNINVGSSWNHLVAAITQAKNTCKGAISELFTDSVADQFDQTHNVLSVDDYFDERDCLSDTPATTLNYTLAGQLIPVFGLAQGGNLYPKPANEPDMLLQHHATSYRKLIQAQL